MYHLRFSLWQKRKQKPQTINIPQNTKNMITVAKEKLYKVYWQKVSRLKENNKIKTYFFNKRKVFHPLGPSYKQTKFQAKTMFATGDTGSLAEWIIYDPTCLVGPVPLIFVIRFVNSQHKKAQCDQADNISQCKYCIDYPIKYFVSKT